MNNFSARVESNDSFIDQNVKDGQELNYTLSDLDHFGGTIEMSFKLEALPMDAIFVNGEQQKVRACEPSSERSWLKCLETLSTRFHYNRCTDNIPIVFNSLYTEDIARQNPKYLKMFSLNLNLLCM